MSGHFAGILTFADMTPRPTACNRAIHLSLRLTTIELSPTTPKPLMEKKKKIVSFGQIDIKNKPLPEFNAESMPLLSTIDLVLFPGVITPIVITRPESATVIDFAFRSEQAVALFCQTVPAEVFPTMPDDLCKFGVPVQVIHMMELEEGVTTAFVRAYPKTTLQLVGIAPDSNTGITMVETKLRRDSMPRKAGDTFHKIVDTLRSETQRMLAAGDGMSELAMNLNSCEDDEAAVNMIGTHLPISPALKMESLGKTRMIERAKSLISAITVNSEMRGMLDEIQQKAREQLGAQQRNTFLQAQYNVLRNELFGDEDDEIAELSEKRALADMPEYADKVFAKELRKLSRFNPQSPDFAVLYTYLETLTELPWNKSSELNSDFAKAEEVLESDHYGMKEVKERILQNLALSIDRKRKDAPILCLVGAPGVGKTSIGRSVAKALGREYRRISLGGVHDEAEIRGHRRTYIGAMPGRIVAAMLSAKVNNPVLLLDEIDKLGADFKGDPNAAMLEAMDPEQNTHFHDNYIDIDFDLSNVFFIATANTLDTVPRPLLDRMEIIEMPGYLPEEKIEIARRHLIPSVRSKHGLKDDEFDLSEEAITKIIGSYTAESGVRTLEKRIAEISRKVILERLRGAEFASTLGADDVVKLLGVEKYSESDRDAATPAGVATGLAWTALGGEILEIEASISPSKGEKLTLTGNLGNVMKESAMLAVQYVRAHADELGVDSSRLSDAELHIHVPEGAVPKDGPSAGITLTTAVVSLLTGRAVRPGVAMTGEMTLRGKVLPVGGIKEKILAAKRKGLTDIYMSRRNERDVKAIEASLLDGLTFHYVDTFGDLSEVFV